MPTYQFRRHSTQEEWEVFTNFAGREEILKDPDVIQIINYTNGFVDPVRLGRQKAPIEFREMLSSIKKRNRGTMNVSGG